MGGTLVEIPETVLRNPVKIPEGTLHKKPAKPVDGRSRFFRDFSEIPLGIYL